ncbi:MAG: cell division protein FtsZ [Ardenticatenaceae bacterium]|nr:cell division protein FtsZ [Anaerolineales bacterium]MCB8923334.1 cell division protein FtsZ [Ardenticatenaceae bacterium]MCB9004666.1 cell division protein FtsZ [Ardenticatenaceae bacterium]
MKRERRTSSLTKIRVVGVGNGGVNAINRLVKRRLTGVEFVVVNTNSFTLAKSIAPTKVHIGHNVTRGHGTGGDVFLGKQAAYESAEQLRKAIEGTDLLFLAASMGGGTGSGVIPVIAEMAHELGILTIAVITSPFSFEGVRQQKAAQESISQLKQFVDTILEIPSDRLLGLMNEGASLDDALRLADGVLGHAIQAISDLVTSSGLINIDFADVQAVLKQPGQLFMMVGQARGEERARLAVSQALDFPLLDLSLDGTQDLLVNVTAGSNLTLGEIRDVVGLIQDAAGPNANLKLGAVFNEHVGQDLRVTVVAKGVVSASSERDGSLAKPMMSKQRPFRIPIPGFLQLTLGRIAHVMS